MGLLDEVRAEAARRNLSPHTAEAYVRWVRRFVIHQGRQHPLDLGTDEVRAFLVALAREQGLAASSRNQALCALRFLYGAVLRQVPEGLEELERARGVGVLPAVLSRSEVERVLASVHGTKRLPVQVLYGCGLRLTECVSLRVKDIDLERRRVHVRQGKGRKDRVTLLPRRLVGPFEEQVAASLAVHQRDREQGGGRVVLPGRLEKRSPGLALEPGWQWLFPATRRYRERETGELRRHHLHQSVLQRAVKRALR